MWLLPTARFPGISGWETLSQLKRAWQQSPVAPQAVHASLMYHPTTQACVGIRLRRGWLPFICIPPATGSSPPQKAESPKCSILSLGTCPACALQALCSRPLPFSVLVLFSWCCCKCFFNSLERGRQGEPEPSPCSTSTGPSNAPPPACTTHSGGQAAQPGTPGSSYPPCPPLPPAPSSPPQTPPHVYLPLS